MNEERQTLEARFRALDPDAPSFSADVRALARVVFGRRGHVWNDENIAFDDEATALIEAVLIAACLDHRSEDRPGLAVLFQSFRPDARHGLPIDSALARYPEFVSRCAAYTFRLFKSRREKAVLAHAFHKIERLFAV